MEQLNDKQTWYQQLLALVLLSASRAAVEFITKPESREEAGNQLQDALAQIDFDAAAQAVTQAIDTLASASKGRLTTTIDTLRDKSFDVVDEAKTRAEDKLAPSKKSGKKLRFLIGLVVGGIIAYFILDEQRRDDLLDRLTGASGPIQQASPTVYQQSTPAAQPASSSGTDNTTDATQPLPQQDDNQTGKVKQ